MRITVFSTHVLWTPHYETDLEIMQRHLDAGDKVTHVVCDRNRSLCDLIVSHNLYRNLSPLLPDRARCTACVTMRKNGTRLLRGRVQLVRISRSSGVVKTSLQSSFADMDELRHYVVDGFDVGEAVLSSVISFCRDPKPDMLVYAELIKRYLRSCYDLYLYALEFIRRTRPDRVYVFNGRLADARAILRACQASQIDCFVHDRAHDLEHYSIFENALPHSRDNAASVIRDLWTREPDCEKKAGIAASFYEGRRRGQGGSWFSFVKDQKPDMLPEGWNGEKRNVAIFCSSEDEFAAAGEEWRNPLYADQLHALRSILADPMIAQNRGIHLYVRLHPNPKTVDNHYVRALHGLSQHNLTLIPADSPVSTYALIDNCDKVLTFGSTVGIEAVYWGKPSILAAESFYHFLGGNYIPQSHSELVEMLLSDLSPKSKEAAIAYGYYMKSPNGIPYKYYRARGVQDGEFKGHDLKRDRHTPGYYLRRGREILGSSRRRVLARLG